MTTSQSKKLNRQYIYDFFSTRGVYHGLFWLCVLIIIMILEGTDRGFLFTLTDGIIYIFFYSLLVYFNLLYLIPNYLTQKKFLTYASLLMLSVLILTPLQMFALHFKYAGYPNIQQDIVNNQFASFLFALFVSATSTLFKIITDWVRQLREKQELQTQTMQSELRFLKSQINPHFLFNTLNNLYALTLKKSDKAPEIVIKLSEMMRYMLYECNEKSVLLQKEVNYIRNYIDLESLRQGQNVQINFQVSGQLSEQQIAPLIFIPFLENAFKHGLNNHITEGFVNIHLAVENQQIHFFIENSKPDKIPIQQPNRPKSGGIGLVNIYRRLNLIYPGQYDLKIENNPKTYAVDLKLDL